MPTVPTGLRNYLIVTSAYWSFTLTDGALRMLVLMHFFRLGYSPFTLAFLFLLFTMVPIMVLQMSDVQSVLLYSSTPYILLEVLHLLRCFLGADV